MEAIVFDGNTLKLEYKNNYPVPKLGSDHEVLVKVAYAGVCGTDLHIIQGEFPALKERPLVLGHEFSGIVEAAGKGTTFKKGQKVVVDPNRACNLCNSCRGGNYHFCSVGGINSTVGIWVDGGWAQYAVVPDFLVYNLPEEVTLEQGGLCEPYSCVAHGYDRAAPLDIGQKILVVGAGIIGNLWLTTLHMHGHRDVTVSEMNKIRLDGVKKLDSGYRLVTPDVLAKEDIEYDVIVDCTGVGKVMEINLHYLKQGGKYVVFGCCPPDQIAKVTPFDIYNKELTIVGVKINPFTFPKAINWLKTMGSRYLDYNRLGVKEFALAEFAQAMEELKTGTIAKAMFRMK